MDRFLIGLAYFNDKCHYHEVEDLISRILNWWLLLHAANRSQLNGQAVHSSAVGVGVAQGGAVYVTATQPGAAAAAAAAAAYLSAGQHQAFASARYCHHLINWSWTYFYHYGSIELQMNF